MTEKINLYDLDLTELIQLLVEMGQPNFRARQIWEWLYRHYAADFAAMHNLPQSLRDDLAGKTFIGQVDIVSIQHSSDGQTEKILSQLPDGQYIETVLMRYEKRRTLCISTQAGCAMGCVFCATGQMGFTRHLSPGEIVGQALYVDDVLQTQGQRLRNIVLMGMDEPRP